VNPTDFELVKNLHITNTTEIISIYTHLLSKLSLFVIALAVGPLHILFNTFVSLDFLIGENESDKIKL
jgi:hypothetical protein